MQLPNIPQFVNIVTWSLWSRGIYCEGLGPLSLNSFGGIAISILQTHETITSFLRDAKREWTLDSLLFIEETSIAMSRSTPSYHERLELSSGDTLKTPTSRQEITTNLPFPQGRILQPGTTSCDIPQHKSSHLRFLAWVAFTRNFDPNIKKMQRQTCPLIGCEISFLDPDTMLQHVYSCPYMSGGLYRCYNCREEVVIGTYHNTESRCGQLRLDMRATIANSIKNLRVSSKAHKGPSRHNQQKSDGLENEADDGYGVESHSSSQTVSKSFNEYSPISNAQLPHIEPHTANNSTTELDSYDILELPGTLSPSAEIVSCGLGERSQSSKSPWFNAEQYPYGCEIEPPEQFPVAELNAGPPHAVSELEGAPENTTAELPASQCPPQAAALKLHTYDSFPANNFSTIRSNRQNQHYLDLRTLPQPQYNLSMEAILFGPDITMMTSQQFPPDLYITSTTDMELTSATYANQAPEIVSDIGSLTYAEPLDLSSSENNSAIVLSSKGMYFSSSAESSPCTETVSTEDLGTCASPRQLQHDGSSPFLHGMDFSGSPTSNSNEFSQSAFQDYFQGSSFSNAPPLMHHKNNAVAPDESLHTISPSRLYKNSATTSTGTPLPSQQQSFSQELLSPAARHSAQDNPDSPLNESLYRCQCGYTPTGKLNNQKSNLKRHKKTCKLYRHLYNRPYKCLFLRCEKTYSRSDGLLNHERKHKHGPVSFQIGS